MVNIPIYCANCEKWIKSGISAEYAHSIQIGGGMSYPCPDCGSYVPYTQGDFKIIAGTLEVVKSQNLTAEGLKDLTRTLQQAIKDNASAEEIQEIIAKNFPKAAGLNKFIKEGWNLPYVLSLIIAFLMWQYPISPPPEKPNKEAIGKEGLEKLKPSQVVSPHQIKVGVNEPCPCGSGKKFKKCCGSK